MPAIAQLDMDIRSRHDPLEADLDVRVDRLDCYQLQATDLAAYAGLLVSPMADQEHLLRHVDRIAEYLAVGGVVVFGGHLHRDWLPGAAPFVPLEARSFRDYEVTVVAEHPVFVGVEARDLTFRRGVAGFFARGHHPAPEGATVLTRLAGGQPSTYVDTVSTGGTILVQASCDLLAFAHRLSGSTASRIPQQLLSWVLAESARLRGDVTEVVR